MTDSIRLCPLSDLVDGQAKGFTVVVGTAADGNVSDRERMDILIVRRGADVYAYVNSCPHVGTPLDWTPDRFMSPDGALLQCATHGARFRIEDGRCVAGPCIGQSLMKLETRICADEVTVRSPGRSSGEKLG